MTYRERRADRRAADAERRAQQKQEPMGRDSIFDLSYDERRRLRRAKKQGQREGEQRAAIEEQAKKQAEYDALPEHEKRPPNKWRQLIELRQKDVGRKDVARRLKVYEREAKIEDERIDAIMEEKKRRHELESAPEFAQALAHWESASANAESEEEREEWARLKGLIEGGGALDYWGQAHPILERRLAKIQESFGNQIERQSEIVNETKALADEVEAVAELQVSPVELQADANEEEEKE